MQATKPKIVFRRFGQPSVDDEPPKKGGAPKKVITPLEKTILAQKGGKLEVLEAPEKPAPGQDVFSFQAQKLAQVENLMFQGIRTPFLIAQAAGISEKAAERYVDAVLARWQTTGGEVDMKEQRGEAVGYMNFLQNQLWTQYGTAKKIVDDQMKLPVGERDYRAISSAKSSMMNLNNQLIALNAQRNQLYGLTPQAIQQMMILGGNDNAEVLVRMRKQQGMQTLAAKLGEILAQRRQMKQAIGHTLET